MDSHYLRRIGVKVGNIYDYVIEREIELRSLRCLVYFVEKNILRIFKYEWEFSLLFLICSMMKVSNSCSSVYTVIKI